MEENYQKAQALGFETLLLKAIRDGRSQHFQRFTGLEPVERWGINIHPEDIKRLNMLVALNHFCLPMHWSLTRKPLLGSLAADQLMKNLLNQLFPKGHPYWMRYSAALKEQELLNQKFHSPMDLLPEEYRRGGVLGFMSIHLCVEAIMSASESRSCAFSLRVEDFIFHYFTGIQMASEFHLSLLPFKSGWSRIVQARFPNLDCVTPEMTMRKFVFREARLQLELALKIAIEMHQYSFQSLAIRTLNKYNLLCELYRKDQIIEKVVR